MSDAEDDGFVFDFTPKKPIKCMHCGKARTHHRAATFECPKGLKNRLGGHNWFGPEVFTPKQPKDKK